MIIFLPRGSHSSNDYHFLGLQDRHLKLSDMFICILSLKKQTIPSLNTYIRVCSDVIYEILKFGLKNSGIHDFVTWLRHVWACLRVATYVQRKDFLCSLINCEYLVNRLRNHNLIGEKLKYAIISNPGRKWPFFMKKWQIFQTLRVPWPSR